MTSRVVSSPVPAPSAPSAATRPERVRLRVVDAAERGVPRDVDAERPADTSALLPLLRRLGIDPGGITELWIDGTLVDVTTSVGSLGVHDGSVLAVIRAGLPRPSIDGDLPRRRRHGPHLRPAGAGVPPDPPPIRVPAAPRPPKDPPSFPWLMALAPLPIAGVMIALLGPRMAVFAALGPLMVIARHFEGRRAARKDARRHADEVAAASAVLRSDLEARQAQVLDALRNAHPDPEERLVLAETGDELWAARRSDPGALAVRVGTMDRPWSPPTVGRDTDGPRDGVFADVIDGHAELLDAPLVVDLGAAPIGIVGDGSARRRLAQSIVSALVVRLGPADLRIGLCCSNDCCSNDCCSADCCSVDSDSRGWDALKWLPHDVEIVATTPPRRDGQATLVVFTEASRFRRDEAARTAPDVDAAIVLAETVADLPAWCGRVIQLDQPTSRPPDDGTTVDGDAIHHATIGLDGAWRQFKPDDPDGDHLDRLARRLAPIRDPEHTASATGPAPVTPLTLHGPSRSHELVRRWRLAEPAALRAIIGRGPTGPLELDLVADGPHVLAAGTTGAGKSELLRSLVLSLACHQPPGDCQFVLVDYKGGGAFDACAALPHTVAVVTDLDEHESARALRGLKAELRRREELLRALDAADIVGYRRAGEQLARLVIVVDEFATLAAELPEFLHSLVDVAQRGRSLGIHLVLATQRPAGVLDNKIRANTNLRICLRVQDPNDSVDVLGVDVASRIARTAHGAGFVRFGDGQITRFQTAYSGAGLDEPGGSAAARPFALVADRSGADPWRSAATTELDALVERIGEAATAANVAVGSPPWLPPLPSSLPAASLPPIEGAVGVLDDPDHQTRRPLMHRTGSGHLLVLGVDGDVTAATVVAVAQQLVMDDPAAHLYRLTDRPRFGSWLATHPAHGATVDVNDLGAVDRLVSLLERRVADRRNGIETAEVIVAADGLGTLYEAAGDAGERDLLARWTALLRDGSSGGITVVGAARSVRSLPGLARAAMPTVWLHRLADPADATAFGVRPRDLPDLEAAMVYEPTLGLVGVVADAASLPPAAITVPPVQPERLASVGPVVARATVPGLAVIEDEVLRLPVGLDLDRGELQTLELRAGRPALVVGGPGAGTSQLLSRLGTEAEAVGLQTIRIGAGETEQVTDDDGGEPTLVVVDDAGRLDESSLTWLGETSRSPRWIVVGADATSIRRSVGPLRTLRGVDNGVVLGLADPPSDLFAASFPKRRPEPSPPGRGWLVGRAGVRAVQAFSD